MHRFARRVRLRVPSSSPRSTASTRQISLSVSSATSRAKSSLLPCNPAHRALGGSWAIDRYYSSSTRRAFSSSSSSTPSADSTERLISLISSIQPEISGTQLATTIVQLLETTKDPNVLAQFEALVTLYALGIDKKKLLNHVQQCTQMSDLELEDSARARVEKDVDSIVEEMDSIGSEAAAEPLSLNAEDFSLEELLGEAEEAVASADDTSEDVLARAIVSVVRANVKAGSSGYGSQGEKIEAERERTRELVDLFTRAAKNAELAGEGVVTEPLFGTVVVEGELADDTSSLGHFVDYAEREVVDEGKNEKLGSQLDQLLQASTSSSSVEFDFGDPTAVESVDPSKELDEEALQRREGKQRLADIVKEFTNEDGLLDSEVADALRAFGFNPSNAPPPRATQSLAKKGQTTPQFSFAQAMAETTRNSSEADNLDTGALASGAKKDSEPFETFPNLMTPDPLMDSRDVREFPPDHESPYHNRVVVRNHASIFHEQMASDGIDLTSDAVIDSWKPEETDEVEEEQQSSVSTNVPLGSKALNELYRFPIFSRRVTQQTGKGKIHRIYSLVIVGNGDGLVGYGEGKDEDSSRAEAKAFSEAVRSMDWVERFEKRTVWTEMETKLGATRLILRPRPVGFGLRCNPYLHQVLKAAGIKDISAKVWGSRNPLNVIKAAFRMLQAGNEPLAMGDGVGGKGRKLNKGSGMRGKGEVERERGRRLVNLRK